MVEVTQQRLEETGTALDRVEVVGRQGTGGQEGGGNAVQTERERLLVLCVVLVPRLGPHWEESSGGSLAR